MKYYVRLARYALEKDIILGSIGDLGIAIPANLLIYYNKSLAEYLKILRKPFFIDPMTYLFRLPENMLKKDNGKKVIDSKGRFKIKKSFEKLIKLYDSNLIEQFKDLIPISHLYFNDPIKLQKFVENNIKYQTNILKDTSHKIARYDMMIGEFLNDDNTLLPEFFVAPYFYADDFADVWYNINRELLKTSKLYEKNNVYAIICMNKNILYNDDAANIIANDYRDADGFLLYLSDFNSETETISFLNRYKTFITDLYSITNKPIIDLYSAGISPYLAYYGLSGVSSGLCILESRNATEQYGFGIARIKFYIPSSHEKITEESLKTTYLQIYDPINECNCNFCKYFSGLKNKMKPSEYISVIDQQFKKNRGKLMNGTMSHFIINRLKEISEINSKPPSEIMKSLRGESNNAVKYVLRLGTRNITEKIINLISD